jgi:hypothetical protein
MEELGLQHSERYGSMLETLGRLDAAQERPQEALLIYDKARTLLVHCKEGQSMGCCSVPWLFATGS